MSDSSNNEVDPRVEWIRSLKDRIDRWIAWTLLAGIFATCLFGLASGAKVGAGTTMGHYLGLLIALSISGGALAIGAMAGFLFGLPRALTSGEVRELARLNSSSADAQDGDGSNAQSSRSAAAARTAQSIAGGFGANTNLERISDWLTTIIVGIGLANLQGLPKAVERFGEKTDAYFAFGGNAFGIGAGFFFVIFGFLMSYISTRTKLMLIFTENERDKQSIDQGALDLAKAIVAAASTSPLPQIQVPVTTTGLQSTATTGGEAGRTVTTTPSNDDALVLTKMSLQDRQTPEQMLAVANASARTGEFTKALVLYQEYMNSMPFDPKVAADYAGVLGMNGEVAGFTELKDKLQKLNASSEVAKADANFALGLRAALQANLYNGRYEDSIRIGEMVIAQPDTKPDAWVHLWLACAYGQRHRALTARQADKAEIDIAKTRAIGEVAKAIEIEHSLRDYIRTLYDPALVKGTDDDLISLFPDTKLSKLLTSPEAS